MKNFLRRFNPVINIYTFLVFFTLNFKISHCINIFWYIGNYLEITKGVRNEMFANVKCYPCLNDKTSDTPVDPTYFYQDTWAARKIFEIKPDMHFDVGSSVKTIGILSQFVPITMIDIRPLPISLQNLVFIHGSILNIPLADNSISTISSLCVVEHIGLGRYGDPIDNFGSEKSIAELKRVVKSDGIVIISVPVDCENTIYFNAHRAFTRQYILSLFNGFILIEEKYQYKYELIDSYSPDRGFGTGMFMFKKLS